MPGREVRSLFSDLDNYDTEPRVSYSTLQDISSAFTNLTATDIVVAYDEIRKFLSDVDKKILPYS